MQKVSFHVLLEMNTEARALKREIARLKEELNFSLR